MLRYKGLVRDSKCENHLYPLFYPQKIICFLKINVLYLW